MISVDMFGYIFLKNKSEVFDYFKQWRIMVENKFDLKIKTFRTDGGGEFCGNDFEAYLKDHGIVHQKTIPKTPEQNGISERMNRTLVEMLRCMLDDSKLPKKFWAEALNTAVYLRNRSPTKSIDNKTPYEKLFGCKPNVKNFKIFGCTAYCHIPKDERRKLDNKSKKCVFLGYGSNIKGYRLFDLNKNKVLYSRDVIFEEIEKDQFDNVVDLGEKRVILPCNDNASIEEETNSDSTIEPNVNSQNESSDSVSCRPRRIVSPPNRYGEWVHVAMADCDTPLTVDEALSGPESKLWKEALDVEMNSLLKNNVWTLETLPEGVIPVGCKFVFKKKIGYDGNIDKYKCRLVALGYSQKFGIDFEETFSPVVRFETIRSIIAFSVQNDFEMHHLDVCSAFLNGDLKECIYMKQPKYNILKGNEGLFCKLNKSIYGLKQAPKCWNESLHDFLTKSDFKAALSDSCLYYRFDEDLFLIAIYVDDIILCCKNADKIKEMKNLLVTEYEIKDLGQLKYFLGVQINKSNDSIWLGQSIYVHNMLKKFNMENCKPMRTPFDYCNKNCVEDEKPFCDVIYKKAVGSLIYLSIRTRPDISFAVNRAAQKCSKPTESDWSNVKRIFRYLKGTADTGIVFSKGSKFECKGFSDADWGGDSITRKSTSGYLFLLCGGPISWQSRKQSSVALSTAEAEFISLASAVQESLWLNNLISVFCRTDSIVINVDNQSAICIAKNNQFHKRTKHVDIKYKFVRDCIDKGLVQLEYCCTELMLADFLTKGLTFVRLNMLKRCSGIVALNI